jgi:hypothetical protein
MRDPEGRIDHVSVRSGNDYCYVIPRGDGTVILGGIREPGNNNPDISLEQRADIIRCALVWQLDQDAHGGQAVPPDRPCCTCPIAECGHHQRHCRSSSRQKERPSHREGAHQREACHSRVWCVCLSAAEPSKVASRRRWVGLWLESRHGLDGGEACAQIMKSSSVKKSWWKRRVAN